MRNPPIGEMLEQFAPMPEEENGEEFYRYLEVVAGTVGQTRNQVNELGQLSQIMRGIRKEFFLQQLAKAAPEDVMDLYRDARVNVATLAEGVLEDERRLRIISSRIQTDPHVAELFTPQTLGLLEKRLDTYKDSYNLYLRNLSWIEEYMDDVIKRAQLPSWVGSISLDADCSDHHLG